jgi:flagellar protein FlgJ
MNISDILTKQPFNPSTTVISEGTLNTASKASERGKLHPALPVKGATQAPSVEAAAKGFEAYFIQQMLTEMRKTIPKTEKPGFGSSIYESMFDQALAQKMSESSGIGLAKQIIETLDAKGYK